VKDLNLIIIKCYYTLEEHKSKIESKKTQKRISKYKENLKTIKKG